VLSEKEVEQLIGAQRPKDNDRAGWRDRALVETLYSCGLRAGEAVALNWSDIDIEMAMVRILHGKGDKFRLVPIGEVALDALDRWRRLTRSNGPNGTEMNRNKSDSTGREKLMSKLRFSCSRRFIRRPTSSRLGGIEEWIRHSESTWVLGDLPWWHRLRFAMENLNKPHALYEHTAFAEALQAILSYHCS
jgi:integrase